MNNHEWLQSLNKEQLASWLAQHECAYTCSYGNRDKDCVEEEYPCEKGILEWLNQEHRFITKENLCTYFTNALRLSIVKNYTLYENVLKEGYTKFVAWKILKEDYEKLDTFKADDYLIEVTKQIVEFLNDKIQCKSFYVKPVECIETDALYFRTSIYVK